MGGTTAKAGLVEHGEVLRTEAIEVGGGVMAGSRLLVGAGYMLKLPAIDLAEVGAGGGSICRLDAGGAPKVGPRQRRRRSGSGLLRPRRHARPPSPIAIWCWAISIPAAWSAARLKLDRDAAARGDRARSGRSAWPAGRASGVWHAPAGRGHDDAGDPRGVGRARPRSAEIRAAGVRRQRSRCLRRGSPQELGIGG